jgi:hypothetical protein
MQKAKRHRPFSGPPDERLKMVDPTLLRERKKDMLPVLCAKQTNWQKETLCYWNT